MFYNINVLNSVLQIKLDIIKAINKFMTTKNPIQKYTDKEALDFHIEGKPGKIEIISSKNLSTQRDLALAYSPGVAVPCVEIGKDPETAYD